MVCNGAQVFLGRCGAYNRDIRILFQQFRHWTGVIRLGVVHNEVVNLGNIYDALDVVKVFIEEIDFYSLHKNILFPGNQIGVIACTIARFHHDVKDAQRRIQNTDRIEIFLQFDCTHSFIIPFQIKT